MYDKYEERKNTCLECGKEFKRSDMLFTRDCHGIPMRLVCSGCYEKIMSNDPGYDGVYYDESDECLDYDY